MRVIHARILGLHVENQASMLEVMVVPEYGRTLPHSSYEFSTFEQWISRKIRGQFASVVKRMMFGSRLSPIQTEFPVDLNPAPL